jgi:hypothetical protein
MSLVLNGGTSGSGTTQAAYAGRIASALPAIVSFWHKNGIATEATGRFVDWVDADATPGNYRMGVSASRSSGPVFSNTTLVRDVSGSPTSFSTRSDLTGGRYRYPLTAITTGATTTIAVDTLGDAMPYVAGMYVKPEGTFTGVSGLVSGREYRVASVAGTNAVLEVATTGEASSGWTGTVRWSAWQPERWNLGVLRFNATGDPISRVTYYGGFVGAPGITIYSTGGGSVGPNTIWDVLDRFCIGGYYQGTTLTAPFRGEFAHVAIWEGVTLDDSRAGELLTKAPHLVGWGSPLAYWPLLADETDSIGSNDLTLIGSPDINSDGPSITLTGGGGGTPGYIPSVMGARQRNIFGVR